MIDLEVTFELDDDGGDGDEDDGDDEQDATSCCIHEAPNAIPADTMMVKNPYFLPLLYPRGDAVVARHLWRGKDSRSPFHDEPLTLFTALNPVNNLRDIIY